MIQFRSCTAKVKGVTPYIGGKMYTEEEVPKLQGETPAAYDERTWQHRLHTNGSGLVVIPGLAFKRALDFGVAWAGERVSGKKSGPAWKKRFESGVYVGDDASLGVEPKDAGCLSKSVPSDGRPGGGKRVTRRFPIFDQWETDVVFHIYDAIIPNEKLEQYFVLAGVYCGVGVWRPENRGNYGRFKVLGYTWQ